MMKLNRVCWVILGMSLIVLMMSGCSSRLQTSVISKDIPSKPEVVQLQEPIQASDSAMEEPQPASLEAETEEGTPFDIPVELPPQPVVRERLPQPIFAAPQEKPIEKSPPVIQAESPDRPKLKEEPMLQQQPTEIAKLAPSEPEIPRVERKEELLKSLVDVYFDYDRVGLREEAFPELATNAELLASQLAGRTIVLEGHCDERGTESYNMILGKRRARAVKDFLVDLGIPKESLSVMSFGKEKPFCTQPTLECWQENRRVHFVVR